MGNTVSLGYNSNSLAIDANGLLYATITGGGGGRGYTFTNPLVVSPTNVVTLNYNGLSLYIDNNGQLSANSYVTTISNNNIEYLVLNQGVPNS